MKISEFFNCKPIAVALIFAFTFASSLNAQSFVQLNDYSGYRQNVSSFQIDSLSYYANEIKEVISLNSAVNDFQVFDFGFYYHSRFFEGDYPEILTLAKNEIESTTSNYFLIAHQVNEIGEIERIRSYFRLDTDDFICLNDSLLSFDLQYLFDDEVVNHKPKDIHEIYDLKLNSLKTLLSVLNEGYCCSQYEELKQSPSRSGEVNFEVLECMEDFGFLSQLYDQLREDTVLQNLLEKVKIISDLFSECIEKGYLKPLAENGIVPMCFWAIHGLEDIPFPINTPLHDIACLSGTIDGIVAELVDIIELHQLAIDIIKYPQQLVNSIIASHSYCKYGIRLSSYHSNILMGWLIEDENLNPTFKGIIAGLSIYYNNQVRVIDYLLNRFEEGCKKHEDRVFQAELLAFMLVEPGSFQMFLINILIELITTFDIGEFGTQRNIYWLCHFTTRVGVNLVGVPKGSAKVAQLKASLVAKNFSTKRLIIGQKVREHLTNLYVKKLEDLPSYKRSLPWEQRQIKNDFSNNPNGLKAVVEGDLVRAWQTIFILEDFRKIPSKLKAVDDFVHIKNIDFSLIRRELRDLPGFKEDLIRGFEISNGTAFPPIIPNRGEVTIPNGKLIGRMENGQFVPVGNAQAAGHMDFVITQNNEILLGTKHVFLSGGSDVLAAGTLKFNNGVIRGITNASGHYLPTPGEGMNFLRFFKNQGADISNATLTLYNEGGTVFKSITPNANIRKLYE